MGGELRDSIRRGSSALDGGHVEKPLSRFKAKEYAPVADTAAKPVLFPFEVLDVALEGIGLHLVDRSTDAGAVARRDAFKRFPRGPGEGDGPFFLLCGVHRGLCSPRA
jgi:hypothetical protein